MAEDRSINNNNNALNMVVKGSCPKSVIRSNRLKEWGRSAPSEQALEKLFFQRAADFIRRNRRY